jgi:hypothetical protein
MSEWKRNKRRTNGFPKGVEEGMVLEVRFRSGDVERRTIGLVEGGNLDPVTPAHFNTKDGYSVDVMAYRIVSEPSAAPAINPPDYSKGFPVGTTAKDIGAKVGDKFCSINSGVVLTLCEDGETAMPKFTGEDGFWRHCYWHNLAPIPPKTAIELQAEEVGIPEQVRLVDDAQQAASNDEPTTAPDFLQSALNTLTQRGKDYDKPEGERSAAAVAVAFNAITGRNLTEAEVWLILQLVNDVRQWQNPERYHADSALDCVAYAALKAEALASGSK